MENKSTFSEILRKILFLESSLKELTLLRDEAFKVFDSYFPLDEMDDVFNSSWKKLSNWSTNHNGVPHFRMQYYTEIEGIFTQVKSAQINRDEFKTALEKSCEAVEDGIQKIQSRLSEEEEKLSKLYNEFAANAGDLTFIFESEQVKQLIMDKLLKS